MPYLIESKQLKYEIFFRLAMFIEQTIIVVIFLLSYTGRLEYTGQEYRTLWEYPKELGIFRSEMSEVFQPPLTRFVISLYSTD